MGRAAAVALAGLGLVGWDGGNPRQVMLRVRMLEAPVRAIGPVGAGSLVLLMQHFPVDQFARYPESPSAGDAGGEPEARPTDLPRDAAPAVAAMRAYEPVSEVALWLAVSENETTAWFDCETPRLFGAQQEGGGAVLRIECSEGPGRLLERWVKDPAGLVQEPVVVSFDPNQAVLAPETARLLDEVLDKIRRVPDLEVLVEGHAEAGEIDSPTLARRRAEAVRQYLAARLGDAGPRVHAVSYASTEEGPLDGGGAETAWVGTRRAQVTLMLPTLNP